MAGAGSRRDLAGVGPDREQGGPGRHARRTGGDSRRQGSSSSSAGSCPQAQIEMTGYGNVLAATAFVMGLSAQELTDSELSARRPGLSVARVRPGEQGGTLIRGGVRGQTLILGYHRVAEVDARSAFALRAPGPRFAEQIDFVRRHAEIVPLERGPRSRTRAPRRHHVRRRLCRQRHRRRADPGGHGRARHVLHRDGDDRQRPGVLVGQAGVSPPGARAPAPPPRAGDQGPPSVDGRAQPHGPPAGALRALVETRRAPRARHRGDPPTTGLRVRLGR